MMLCLVGSFSVFCSSFPIGPFGLLVDAGGGQSSSRRLFLPLTLICAHFCYRRKQQMGAISLEIQQVSGWVQTLPSSSLRLTFGDVMRCGAVFPRDEETHILATCTDKTTTRASERVRLPASELDHLRYCPRTRVGRREFSSTTSRQTKQLLRRKRLYRTYSLVSLVYHAVMVSMMMMKPSSFFLLPSIYFFFVMRE